MKRATIIPITLIGTAKHLARFADAFSRVFCHKQMKAITGLFFDPAVGKVAARDGSIASRRGVRGKTKKPYLFWQVSVILSAGAAIGGAPAQDDKPPDRWYPGVVISTHPERFQPVDLVELPAGVPVELPDLPRGRQELGGFAWEVKEPAILAPGGALDLGLVGKVTELHLLQTARGGPAIQRWRAAVAESIRQHTPRPDYPVVAKVIFSYADKSLAAVPLRWGEATENAGRRTFEPVARFVGPMGWGHVAWQGQQDYDLDVWPTAYVARIPNPRPELEVAATRLEGVADDFGKLALFATRAESAPLPGRLLFVSAQGDDGNDGSYLKPFRSPQHAANTARAGDTVYFRSGTYAVANPVMPQHSGLENRWITFSGYPGETAVIDGNALHTDNLPDNPNYYAVQLGEQKIEMLASRTGTFHIFQRSYIRVMNLSVHRSPFSGIAVDNAQGSWLEKHDPEVKGSSHHLDFLFNRVYLAAQAGLGVFSNFNVEPKTPVRHVRAIGNQILSAYDHDYTQTTTGPGHQETTREAMSGVRNRDRGGGRKASSFGDENLDFHGVHHLEVGYNEVFAGGKEGIDLMIGTRHARVHHNFVHDNFMFYHFGGGKIGIYLDNRRHQWDLEVDHNVTRQTGVGVVSTNEDGREGKEISIHHNLCVDNLWEGIGLWSYDGEKAMHHEAALHNTCFQNGYFDRNDRAGGSISIGDTKNQHDILVRNNLAVGGRDYNIAVHPKADLAGRNVTVDYNLSWPAEYPPIAGKEAERKTHHPGEHALLADPGLIAPAKWNFNLRAGSPALDAGHPDTKDPDGSRADLGAFPRMRDGVQSSWRAPCEPLW